MHRSNRGPSESPSGELPRRNFFRMLAGSTALSVVALESLNAAIYEGIENLNSGLRQDESPDGIYWEEIRKHFMFEGRLIMMNNGTLGPMPKPVFNTMMRYFKIQASNPFEAYDFFPSLRDGVRNKLADFVGASPDEIVIDRNTTEGMNFIAGGLDLGEGDEVLQSTMEHPAGIHPWRLKAARYGITVTDVPIGVPPRDVNEIVRAFRNAITPQTRVISISHTVFITGLIAPVKELSEMAHERGILLLTDSAHGLGHLDLDMHDLGIDFFTTSPYKWLGAPTGCGMLYVKSDVQDRVWPTIASSGWDQEGTARKFETLGQRADPIIFALGEALDFQNRIGKDRIARRIRSLATHLKDGLAAIPGVKLHTSRDPYLSAGLTAFSIEGVDPQRIVDYVRERYNIVIRTIGSESAGTRGVRVSTHIWLNTRHVDMLLEGVDHLASHRG